MNALQGVVVHESACPLEGWDDAIRGRIVWRTLLSGDRTPTAQMTLGVEHALRAGSSVFIPGDVWHGARNTGTQMLRLLYVFATDSFSDVNYVFPDREQA